MCERERERGEREERERGRGKKERVREICSKKKLDSSGRVEPKLGVAFRVDVIWKLIKSLLPSLLTNICTQCFSFKGPNALYLGFRSFL